MPSLALRSLWEATTAPAAVAASGGGHDHERRPRRTRVPLEQHLLALWTAGQITDAELEKLLKGH